LKLTSSTEQGNCETSAIETNDEGRTIAMIKHAKRMQQQGEGKSKQEQ
jgi:hypothetical protein